MFLKSPEANGNSLEKEMLWKNNLNYLQFQSTYFKYDNTKRDCIFVQLHFQNGFCFLVFA